VRSGIGVEREWEGVWVEGRRVGRWEKWRLDCLVI
jgi:hypothetical protein